MPRITPFLWFDHQAEEAATFYTSVFKNSKVGRIFRYTEQAAEKTGRPVGSVLTVEFEIESQKFVALNGGPLFKFNESISFVVNCDSQEEVDYFWEKLTADGGEESACGWLTDKFGLSWQVVPTSVGFGPLNTRNYTKMSEITFSFIRLIRVFRGKNLNYEQSSSLSWHKERRVHPGFGWRA